MNFVWVLEQHPNKIDWHEFSKNPAIFKNYHVHEHEYVLK